MADMFVSICLYHQSLYLQRYQPSFVYLFSNYLLHSYVLGNMLIIDVLCFISQLCQLFATPWTAACQAPLLVGILQARILEWVAMPSSRESS